MKQKDEYLIIRYWSGELTKKEEIRVLEILNSEADGEEATHLLDSLRLQHDLLGGERATSHLPFSEGELLEQSLDQWEKETKVVFFKSRWLAPTIGVAATLTIAALVFKHSPIKQNQTNDSDTDNLAVPPVVTSLPEVGGMYSINRQVSELELAIDEAGKTRRFSRYNSNPENN